LIRPSFDLTGKTALITGGSRGLGHAMAYALGSYGAKVFITSRGIEEGQLAERKLTEEGIQATYYQCDVTDKPEIEHVVDRIVLNSGSLDILVNNAGLNIRKSLIEVQESDWDYVVNINLKGAFLVGQTVAKQMIKQEYGRIINISSMLGSIGMPFQTSYAASKGGINQITKVWAEELAPYHITVNALGPGYIKTNANEQWLSDPERVQKIVDNTMLKRLGELSDMAGPIVFLASESSSYVTGQIINIDGGWTAR
jgi:gluconate 5-dehydrogenase